MKCEQCASSAVPEVCPVGEPAEADTTDGTIDQALVSKRLADCLRRIVRALEVHSRRLIAEHRITSPQLACLLALREGGAMTVTAIARQVHLSPSTVVGILDRLEERGFVRRERDTRDRRLLNVTLTEEGRGLADSAPSPLQNTLADALVALPHAEQVAVVHSLEKIVGMMEGASLSADKASFSQ